MINIIKDITWIGDIYQKIQEMFEEIDEILSQNAVKYGEDEVQTGGEREKNVCSNFNHKTRAASVERNFATCGCTSSEICIEHIPVGSFIQPSHVKDNTTETVQTQLGHASCGIHLENPLATKSAVVVQTEAGFSMEQIDQYLENKMLDISIDENATKEKSSVPEVLELISSVEKSFETPFLKELINDNRETTSGFRSSLVQDPEFGSPGKKGTIGTAVFYDTDCDSDASSTLTSSGMDCPVVYYSMNEAVTRCFDPSSSVLSFKSLEEDTSKTNETVSLTESSGNRQPQFKDSTQFKAAISTSDVGHSNDFSSFVTDQEMETTELLSRVKISESCIIVDSSDFYDVPNRDQERRSYRKSIWDIFSMNKKSVKEYEQLAAWHGDIDSTSLQNTTKTLSPSTSTTPLDLESLQTNHTCDSEWEF